MVLHPRRYLAQVLDRIIVVVGSELKALRGEKRHCFDFSLGLGFRFSSEGDVNASKEGRPERVTGKR